MNISYKKAIIKLDYRKIREKVHQKKMRIGYSAGFDEIQRTLNHACKKMHLPNEGRSVKIKIFDN